MTIDCAVPCLAVAKRPVSCCFFSRRFAGGGGERSDPALGANSAALMSAHRAAAERAVGGSHVTSLLRAVEAPLQEPRMQPSNARLGQSEAGKKSRDARSNSMRCKQRGYMRQAHPNPLPSRDRGFSFRRARNSTSRR